MGQSFTVVGAGTYTDVSFNFYTWPAPGVPYAIGTGYLFSALYAGTPAGLSSADPGFLGTGAAVGNVYSFGPSVTLTAGDQYYFYEDALIPVNSISGEVSYSGGEGCGAYFVPTQNFSCNPESFNFLVTGSPTATTPEPSSLLLLGGSLLVFGGAAWRRLRRT